MNEKEEKLQMFTIGRNALISAIMALDSEFFIHELEDLRDAVNDRIKELEMDLKDEWFHKRRTRNIKSYDDAYKNNLPTNLSNL